MTTDPTVTQIPGAAGRSTEISDKIKNHVLDTIRAMLSGIRLRPGKTAIDLIVGE